MNFHHSQSPFKVLMDRRPSGGTMPEILCTLGPASLDRRTIQRLEQSGATLFRINLSHAKLAELPRMIQTIRDATRVPICLDTEGAQIRTGEFVDGSIHLRDNTVVRVHFRRVPADDKNFPPESRRSWSWATSSASTSIRPWRRSSPRTTIASRCACYKADSSDRTRPSRSSVTSRCRR